MFFPLKKQRQALPHLIYTSYYDSKVTFYTEDIEDLNLLSEKKIKLSTTNGEDKQINLILVREPKKSILWNIFLILIPLFFYILERKWNVRWWIRILAYTIAFISLWLKIPTPLNVPRFNILNIVTWSLYALLIGIIEILLFKKRKTKNRQAE